MSDGDVPTGIDPTTADGGKPDHCGAFRADVHLPQRSDDHYRRAVTTVRPTP